MTTIHTIVESPLGGLTVVAEDGVLTGLYFPNHWYQPDRSAFGVRDDQGFDEVTHQLKEYFAGQRTEFDLPIRARRRRVPAHGLGSDRSDSLRRNHHLWRHCFGDLVTCPRCRRGGWWQPVVHSPALPSGGG